MFPLKGEQILEAQGVNEPWVFAPPRMRPAGGTSWAEAVAKPAGNSDCFQGLARREQNTGWEPMLHWLLSCCPSGTKYIHPPRPLIKLALMGFQPV